MDTNSLNQPILIAAWPGMGQVALTASYYLIAKLKMDVMAEYVSSELFDVDHVSVADGLVQPFRYPKNQFFAWRNPGGGSDLLVFMGEAQPPHGRYNFCRKLIEYAQTKGISQVLTFAAMASPIGLEDQCRVVAAATDESTRDQMVENDVNLLASGSISGMNGIMLGVAAERKLAGGCLLGEMPHTFINVPFPKASLAILEKFKEITGTDIDLSELEREVERMQQHLADAISQIRRLEQQQQEPEYGSDEETFIPDPADNGRLSPEEMERIEQLFREAEEDRSKAYELKRELDRLDVFRDYEDRFLDLFKEQE